MAKFRKKPVVVDVIQWTGSNILECGDFMGGEAERNITWNHNSATNALNIYTLEGIHRANIGDWLIRGVKGEFYPCKPDIFEQTYEAVEE